ncbi:MAG: hypothetical protein FJW20_03705 [Acidimicrobiia bacterium]|nr:hypothetical protein [Acidimicrobiia bacterium]
MESVLASLGALMLRAVPTFLILLLLHLYLKRVFYQPMEKALSERNRATAGVKKLAEESLEKATRKAAEYEDAIRAARSTLYKEQEAKRVAWRNEQTASLQAMRGKADTQVAEARQKLSAEKEAAKASLGAESEALAEQIARTVLTGGVN